MARRRLVVAPCHICGFTKKLSFEHSPPETAFNDRAIRQICGAQVFQQIDDLENLRGQISQRGSGAYTLCEQCNNDTGAWYGPAFVSWSYQAARILALTQGRASLYYQYRIFPLRAIKQIVCMFCSANGPGFQKAHPDLVRFLLNKEQKYLDPSLRIYAFLTDSTRSRQTGVVASVNLESHKSRAFSETTFAPFGFVMSLSQDLPDDRLIDITFFSRYRYNDWKEISLNLPTLPIYTYLPGDYRSRDQVIAEMKTNRAD